MIIIDKIINNTSGNASDAYQVPIVSQDQVVLVFIATNTSNSPLLTFNGVTIPQYIPDTANIAQSVYYINSPPVGNITLNFSVTNPGYDIAIIILSGADKSIASPSFISTAPVTAPASVILNTPAPNSIIFTFISSTGTTILPSTVEQTYFHGQPGGGTIGAYQYGYGQVLSSWNGGISFTGAIISIALSPKDPSDISNANLGARSQFDANNTAGLNVLSSANLNQTNQFSLQLYKRSFLHTVGRVGTNLTDLSPPSTIGGQNVQSGIIIDKITSFERIISVTSWTFDHLVSSQDAVLIIGVAGNGGTYTASYNGVALNQVATAVQSGNNGASLFYMINPPVGINTVVVTSSSSTNLDVFAMTLLGVDKKTTNLTSTVISAASGVPSGSIQPQSANSLIIAFMSIGLTLKNDPTYTTFFSSSNEGVFGGFKLGQGLIPFNAVGTSARSAIAIIAIEPNNAPSIAFPSINNRNITDVIRKNALDVTDFPGSSPFNSYGNYPSNFYLNSFLHTVGRMPRSNPIVGTVTGETEQQTSQIIIDKVFQGQVASQALSIVTLTMDVSIPSPDAILVVTGGSVIATGAGWANVQFNGNNLTQLVQTSVAGADAEIWYLPFPTVGTYQLVITSGTGGEIYANAMVILGVDKRSTNIEVASNTDVANTTTIGTLITPDAPNSLIIDTLSTLNTTTFPVPDSSQNQIFNASALAGNEYVLSTYKIASTPQNMNYNLSVAVNAALVAVAFRPAQAPSQWFPNIDSRSLDDVTDVAGLDAEVNPPFGQYGYKPTTFYLNSFLHTVGRTFQNYNPPLVGISWNNTAQIIIDDTTLGPDSNTTSHFLHRVNSEDAILTVLVTSTQGIPASVQFNGNYLTLLSGIAESGSGSQGASSIWFMLNPPVGTYAVDIQSAGTGNIQGQAITLLGVNKKALNPITAATTVTTNPNGTVALNINPTSANSLIIDNLVTWTANNGLYQVDPSQTQLSTGENVSPASISSSFKYASPGTQTMAWYATKSTNAQNVQYWAYTAVAFEPAQAPSMWFPVISNRNSNDTNVFDWGDTPFPYNIGYKPSNFWQNSFLHTVGRYSKGVPAIAVTNHWLPLLGVGT